VVSPEYVEGLLALYEGRYEDALTLAERCSGAADWFYECGLVEGNAWFQLAIDRRRRGEGEAAVEAFERADAAYRSVTHIAGSDPRGYAGICHVWTRVLEMRLYDTGGELDSVVERALEACGRSLEADHEMSDALGDTVSCYRILAEAKLHREEDPTEALSAAKEAAARLVALAPDQARSHQLAAHAHIFSCGALMMRGEDGSDDAEAAVANLTKAVELDPASAGIYLDLGFALRIQAESIEARGGDPFPELERAAAAYGRSAELSPGYADPLNNLADLQIRWAELSSARGDNPIPVLDRALANCSKALEIKPDHMFATANRGIAHLRRAQFLESTGGAPEEDLEAAISSLEGAVDLNPDHPSNHLYLAEAARDLARQRLSAGLPADELRRQGLEAVAEALRRVPEWPAAVALREELRNLG
jgi:serine/threonine-protein kinase